MSATAAARRAAALEPPRAHGGPAGRARLKAAAEDFRVEERLGFVADGGGAHRLLRVEKRGRDTLAVVRELARLAGCAPRDVGFAGLKDRHAIATQYFTVPAPRAGETLAGQAGDGFAVLSAEPHSRKLRRGALAGNAFEILLREVEVDAPRLGERLAAVAARGVPNYFGTQRFGRDGSNLEAIERWQAGGPLPRGREPRAFVLSAARSLLFNTVLAARVRAGSWDRLLAGELVNLAGRQSWFAAGEIDATLEERLARHDIHPTGPLAGRGPAPSAAAGAAEAAALAAEASLGEALAAAGLEAARRPLRVLAEGFRADLEPGTLRLAFRLPPGAYATAVVRELVDTPDLAPEHSDD
ncbi:MAG: tRNA pseudouridine(13) synthase TruD [Proteobacteria bacterium]|nr:tRNA pseudouridine(13) synthase TruD [Pseudomonadota bacterium]